MPHCRPATALVAALLFVWISGCGYERERASAAVEAPAADVTANPANEADQQIPPATERPKLLPGAKTKALAAAGDRPFDKTFDNIRFDIEPGEPFHREMLPESIEALAGQRIRIRGYILPTPQRRGIKTFVLVRDNQECCFGPGAALYDCILVEMQPGKTAEFSIRPVTVEGTFDIREFLGPDGKHLAIYYLEAESVR